MESSAGIIVMLTDEELKACADKVRRKYAEMKDLLGEDLYTEVRLNSMVE
jgi:hypothetical protein